VFAYNTLYLILYHRASIYKSAEAVIASINIDLKVMHPWNLKHKRELFLSSQLILLRDL
jgi:hypothetical protein